MLWAAVPGCYVESLVSPRTNSLSNFKLNSSATMRNHSNLRESARAARMFPVSINLAVKAAVS